MLLTSSSLCKPVLNHTALTEDMDGIAHTESKYDLKRSKRITIYKNILDIFGAAYFQTLVARGSFLTKSYDGSCFLLQADCNALWDSWM